MADNATGASLSDEATLKMLERERKANNAWHKLARNKMALVGLAIVVVMVILAVFAPLLAPCDPNATDTGNMFAAPGVGGHLFGTDAFGRDLLSRVIYGARISIFIAIGGTILGAIVGILLGLVAGFFGGIVDSVIMRIMDGMMAFPFILLSLILMTILGQGTINVIIACWRAWKRPGRWISAPVPAVWALASSGSARRRRSSAWKRARKPTSISRKIPVWP